MELATADAVQPRDGEAALIMADAAVELSARGIMISWRAGLHLLLFLLPFLLWVWRARRVTAPRQEPDLDDAEVQTEEGGDALQELLEAKRRTAAQKEKYKRSPKGILKGSPAGSVTFRK